MAEHTVTVVRPGGRGIDLTVTARPGAPAADVLAELLQAAGEPAGPVWLDGRLFAPAGEWRSCGVRHGSVMAVGERPGCPDLSLPALHVVAGPAAGAVLPLPPAGVTIGRDPACDLALDDDEVSRRHVEVSHNLRVRDLGSTNGTAVGGVALGPGDLLLTPGTLLQVGESQLALHPSRDDHAAVIRGEGQQLVLNRPPRRRPAAAAPPEIVLPTEPAVPERGRLPLVAVVVPILLGAVLFLTMPSSPQYLLLMAMSPVLVVGNLVSDRHGGRRRHRRDLRAYAVATAEARAAVDEACRVDEVASRAASPDPAELLVRATLPSSRLWERRRSDPDRLLLRLGVADQPARLRVTPPEAALVRNTPVVLPLDEVGVLGIAGDVRQSLALTRWLVCQAATLLAPGDLTVVVLTTAATACEWDWLRWLPHAAGRHSRVLVGVDPATWAARVAEVTELAGVARARDGRPVGTGLSVLLVVDGARELRQVPGLAALLAQAPAGGLQAICRDTQERLLPLECGAVAAFDTAARLTLRRGDGTTLGDVLADQVSTSWADRLARGLAVIEAPGDSADSSLPTSVRLLDLVGLPMPTGPEIDRRWRHNGPSTSALVGVGADGPLALDLTRDGPHVLVAGTTGAGKSELLQTLVASLALANPPEALTFVLVDYKGGAAFRDCARLPHTVGLVTDLDARLTERALASLSAELRHRERLLAAHGVKDYETLWSRAPGELARLVLVIDEFATLVEELPEFVRGLVGIAQRGRSLGLHLVLATQRPGGVVSPDIRANTNLRICLRVTQAGESSDVIEAPDAAGIAAELPGRGFFRTGAGTLRGFQAARVGGPAAGPADTSTRVVALTLADLGRTGEAAAAAADADGPTDLSLLVDAVREAAAGRPPARRPWLDPLPALLTLGELPPVDGGLRLGQTDLPELQQRRTFALRPGQDGHLLVVGSARSGRSAVLQVAAAGIADDWSPDELHLYALDFGNQGLAPLAALPHCGAVVSRDQPERLERLLARLLGEVEARQSALACAGFADLAEQRRYSDAQERLPWIVLLVDRWESFVQTYQDVDLGRRVEELLRLLREGPSVGLLAVVTADRSGLLGRLPSVMPDRLVLGLADRADYALADIPARLAPATPPPGRGLVPSGEQTRGFHEVQIALLTADPAGPAQLTALRDKISAAAATHDRHRQHRAPRHQLLRVDPLPARVTVGHALSLGSSPPGLWALIGVGGDRLAPVGVDLAEDGPGFLVVGAPRSGRSTALVTMAESLLRSGRQVCLVAPGRSPLAQLADHPGVTGWLDAASTDEEACRVLSAGAQPPVIVVDDAERLTDTAVGLALERELLAEPSRGPYIVAAGNSEDLHSTYRGFTVGLRRSRCGLLINPQSTLDGDLVGARLPRQLNGSRHAGRALLAVRGELTAVQVARG